MIDRRRLRAVLLGATVSTILLAGTAGIAAANGTGVGTRGAAPVTGEPSSGMPAPLQEVRFEQRLGAQVPLDVELLDSTGRTVTLGETIGDRPALLAFVYHDCPMLCTQVLNGIVSALKVLKFTPGEEFDVVAVSFNAHDTPESAAAQKAMYLERYGHPETAGGWHFLTGKQEAIDALTTAVGFAYGTDDERRQYAHAAGITILTPAGKIARVFYGIEYPPRDLRLSLIEASEETIGTFVDQVLLYCYAYNPSTGRYGAVVMRIVRLAGAATVLVLVVGIGLALARDRRRAPTREVTT